MKLKFQLIFAMACVVAMSGCETVGNVAQTVADTARASANGTKTSTSQTAATSPSSNGETAKPACERNFTVSGSLFSGKKYRTSVPYPGVDPDVLYKKTYSEVVKRGWQIISADKDFRSISTSQGVVFSNGKTVPLNFFVEGDGKKGAIFTISYALSGGVIASESAVLDDFCDFANSISNRAN